MTAFRTIFICFIIKSIAVSARPNQEFLEDIVPFSQCIPYINQERVNYEKPPLEINILVEKAAYNHTKHMLENDCFDSQCPGELDPGARLSFLKYEWSAQGETISVGITNCGDLMTQWMGIPESRDVLLGDFVHVGCWGVSCRTCPNPGPWWTCDFASPI